MAGAQAATAWRAGRRRAAAGMARGRAALARHLDGGYMPVAAGAPREPPTIALAGVTLAYRSTVAVDSMTGTFPPRSMTAIVGPNGAGKSTLLKAVAGIIRPRAGTLSLGGAGLGDLAYLPQSEEVDRFFPITVIEFVALGGWRQFGAFRPAAAIVAEAAATLARVGLGDAARRPIAALSTGEFRRALFARTSLQQAQIRLLDEPFAAIDAATTADLMRLVERWHREGCTIIAVLHDLAQVREHFPQTLVMARRGIAWGDTAQALSAENLARAGLVTDPEMIR
jgi:zinc/manganese transport system ATP-binding protein